MRAVPRARPATAIVVLLLLAGAVTPAAAKSYRALDVEVRAELERDRSLAVTETIRFRFEDGTFTEVYRDVPLRRSDGVTDVSAAMDGVALPPGTGPGQVEIEAGSRRLRVRWHFPPLDGDHTFELRYRLLGVVTQGRDEDVLEWHVLPDERRYHIDTMRAQIALPPGAVLTPDLTIGPSTVEVVQTAAGLALAAADLARNRDVRVRLPMTGRAFVAEGPAWQGLRATQLARGPWMIGAGGLVLLAGFGWLALFRSSWRMDPLPALESQVTFPPDPLLPVGLAARLARCSVQAQALATVFDLAHRGRLHIEERAARGLTRGRGFVVRLAAGGAGLAPHERTLLDTIFPPDAGTREITLGRLQRRLARLSAFEAAISSEMRQRGLLDPDRVDARRTLTRAVFTALAALVASIGLAALLAPMFGPWAMVLPGAWLLVLLAIAIAHGTFPVLTRPGLREARRWKTFGRYLADVGRGKAGDAATLQHDWLPYLVAAGAASAWAKRLRKQAGAVPVPDWFRAAADTADEQSAAFAALLATTATSSGGGVHAGGAGSGAAGGGASGAS